MSQRNALFVKELFIEKERRCGSYLLYYLPNFEQNAMASFGFGSSVEEDVRRRTAFAPRNLDPRDWIKMTKEELESKIQDAMLDSGLVTEVNRLMDAELVYFDNICTSTSEGEPTLQSMDEKSNQIANYRYNRVDVDVPGDFEAAGAPDSHTSFVCYISLLAGGQAEYQDRAKVYFDYDTTFIDFITNLQLYTWNCIIPPINLTAPTQPDTEAEWEPQSPIFGDRTADFAGYTLLDGPWIYRLTPKLTSERECDARKPIAHELHYQDMVETLRSHNTNQDPTKGEAERRVIIQHSIDVAARSKYKTERRAHLREDQAMEESFQADFRAGRINDLGAMDAEDFGIPYMEALVREHERQQRENEGENEVGSRTSSGFGFSIASTLPDDEDEFDEGTPAVAERNGDQLAGDSADSSNQLEGSSDNYDQMAGLLDDDYQL